jgi:hypothetical protein
VFCDGDERLANRLADVRITGRTGKGLQAVLL